MTNTALSLSRLLTALLLLTTGLMACSDTNSPAPTAASQTELLVGNNWRVSNVTDASGATLNRNRLNLTTNLLFDLNMQFRNDNTVRALDPTQGNIVVNGGTWTLATDNKSIDVDVKQFKGNFPLIELNRSKMILRQSAPVDGKDTPINLEFSPAL